MSRKGPNVYIKQTWGVIHMLTIPFTSNKQHGYTIWIQDPVNLTLRYWLVNWNMYLYGGGVTHTLTVSPYFCFILFCELCALRNKWILSFTPQFWNLSDLRHGGLNPLSHSPVSIHWPACTHPSNVKCADNEPIIHVGFVRVLVNMCPRAIVVCTCETLFCISKVMRNRGSHDFCKRTLIYMSAFSDLRVRVVSQYIYMHTGLNVLTMN